MSHVVKLSESNLSCLGEGSGVALLDFYADWCGPCQALAPTIENVASQNPNVTVAKIDVDENENVAVQFGITGIPTLVFLHHGREVARLLGPVSQDAIEYLLERIDI